MVLLLLPLLLALPVVVLAWRYRFDGLYGQDAFAYYRYAVGPLRENLLALRPPPPFFWPPGYPLLVTLLSLPLGTAPAAGQVVSLVAGALTPLLTALLAQSLWRPDEEMAAAETGPSARLAGLWIPLLAGLFTAATGQLWQSSAVVMSDTTGLAAATLGMWAVARYGRGGGGRWLALAAAAMAFAILSRWAYALVALPCAGYALYVLAQRPRQLALRHASVAALMALLILSPVLASAWRQTAMAGSERTSFIGDLQVVGWNPLNALRNEFTTSDGVLRYRLPNGLYYALAPAHRYTFTPLLAWLLLPGLWTLWRRRTPARLLLLLGWAGVVYVFLAGIAWQNFRFTLAYLPPLAIVAAAGVVTVARWLPSRTRWLPGLLVVIGLGWMASGGWALTESFIVRKQADLSTVGWVEAQVEPEARLFTFHITLTFEQYSDVEVHDLFLLTPDEMAALLQTARPAYLLLDLGNVETQWAGRAPSQNYHWLQQEAGLVELGQHRHFTFFRIGRQPP